jgi:hypothetical protein
MPWMRASTQAGWVARDGRRRTLGRIEVLDPASNVLFGQERERRGNLAQLGVLRQAGRADVEVLAYLGLFGGGKGAEHVESHQ